MIVEIYGESDDLVAIESQHHSWEISSDDTLIEFLHTPGDGTVEQTFVRVRYEDTGTWSVTPYQGGEDIPMALRGIIFEPRAYTMRLIASMSEETEIIVKEETDA